MMNQREKQRTQTIAVSDKPIAKPQEDIPEEFLRSVEARFVTKRFPKSETRSHSRARHRDN
jgi:hypothetical protein